MTAPTEAIPDTPARLSSVDRSLEGGGQVSPNHGSAGEPGASPAGTGERGGSSAGDGPREISSASIRILSQVQPTYPAMAKLARIQGPVVLRMTIDSQGIPTEVQVASGHHALQAEAVRAARLWRFVPATVDGLPTAATFQLTILFTLR
jgi:protein TonB